MKGKVQNTTYYQKEIFRDIKCYLDTIEISYEIVIGGDYNQDIVSKEVVDFHAELGVRDAYSLFNMIELEDLDYVFIARSKYIDSIAASYNLIEFVEGSQLYNTNKIINTDYRSYMIDINIE